MRGYVTCTFVGGPSEGERRLLARQCQDLIRVPQTTWFAPGPDDTVVLMSDPSGRVQPGGKHPESGKYVPWVSFQVAIYRKRKPVQPGDVIYDFEQMDTVDRCEQLLDAKPGRLARRCRNVALSGTAHCRQHQK